MDICIAMVERAPGPHHVLYVKGTWEPGDIRLVFADGAFTIVYEKQKQKRISADEWLMRSGETEFRLERRRPEYNMITGEFITADYELTLVE